MTSTRISTLTLTVTVPLSTNVGIALVRDLVFSGSPSARTRVQMQAHYVHV